MTDERIVGTSREGDFVLAGQELATKEGFRNVAKIWYGQTQSYEDGLEMVTKMADLREDIVCKPIQMTPMFDEDTGEVYFEYVDGRKFLFTPHALRQYGTNAGNIPHTYLNWMGGPVLKPNGKVRYKRDAQDNFALYTVLKNGHRRMKNEEYRWRTYKGVDGEHGTIRAVLTKMYAAIDNRWYLEKLKEMIPGGRLSHFNYANADTIYGNVLIPDTIREETDSDYGGMISIGNCEIGLRPWTQLPSVFRAICMNGCIWGQEKGWRLKVVHRRKDGVINHDELAESMRDNIHKQIPLLTTGIDKLIATRTLMLADDVQPRQMLGQIAKDCTLTGSETIELFSAYNQFAKNGDNARTAFGMVDSLTRMGQKFPANRWYSADLYAGKLVTGETDWSKLNKRAATLSDADLEKLAKRGMAVAV